MTDDRFLEYSEGMVEREREMAAKTAQAALRPSGQVSCDACGCTISAARLSVAPFAVRCLQCQQHHERRKRLYR